MKNLGVFGDSSKSFQEIPRKETILKLALRSPNLSSLLVNLSSKDLVFMADSNGVVKKKVI